MKDAATQVWLDSIFKSQRSVAIVAGGLISGNLVKRVVEPKNYGVGSYERLALLVGVSFLVAWVVFEGEGVYVCRPVRIISSIGTKEQSWKRWAIC